MEYGVVFSGGGSRGSYEIGVWKALLEMGIDIKAVAGTSVGALNGAMLVQGDFDIACDIWLNLEIQKIVNLENITLNEENHISLRDIVTSFRNLWKVGGLDITPLKKLLDDYIDEERILKSETDFGLVTFSLSDFKPMVMYKEDIPKGQLINYLIASASLPIFKQQVIENKKFMDGGIYDNIPVSLLVKKGLKNIIVVDCSWLGIVRKIFYDGVNTIYIKNSQPLGGILQFDRETIKNNIQIGYLDALKAFGKLKGKKYFLDLDVNTRKLAAPLTQKSIDTLFSLLDINKERLPNDRFSNYRILRTIKRYTDKELNAATAVLAALEITAEIFDINTRKIYTPDELVTLIVEEYYKIKDSEFVSNPVKTLKKLIPDKINELKNTDLKYLAAIGVGDDETMNMLLYRKFLATTLPRICIANLFLSLIMSRLEQNNNMSEISN